MITAGIIAEYNPFHNGHHFHIEETRRKTGADFIIVVMSGNFTQRGTPALTDKYARTRMALLGGADLVLELPVMFAAGSAGDFAFGAVSLLDKLHVADYLSFGSEAGSLETMTQAARLLAAEPPAFSASLKQELKNGSSFARARSAALNRTLSQPLPEGPNNLLGLEYCTALYKRASSIIPFTIPRCGAGYHDLTLSDVMPSAVSIRKFLEVSAPNDPTATDILSRNVPPQTLAVWEDLLSDRRFLFPADLTKELRYRLISEPDCNFSQYADVTRELSDKLKNNRLDFTDWDDLCMRLKSKELTYSRISRTLCHILLGIRSEQLQQARENDFVPYARLLGFRQSALPLLSAIKKNSDIPLISKLADASRNLSPYGLSLLEQDITAAHLYESALSCKCGLPLRNEYRQQIIVIPE